MDESLAITEVIEDVRQGRQDSGLLFLYFQEALERYARHQIGAALQSFIGGSDVYTESFQAVINALKESDKETENRQVFAAQLRTTIRNKVTDTHRKMTALKRTGGRSSVSLDDAPELADRDAEVDEQAVARELQRQIEAYLESIVDPRDRVAVTESLVYGSSVPAIRASLLLMFPPETVPSESTIRRSLKSGFKELRDTLMRDWDNSPVE